jgi:hypothetical protein
MTFENVYKAIRNAVLSTAIYRDFVDKDFWSGQKACLGSLTGLLPVEFSDWSISGRKPGRRWSNRHVLWLYFSTRKSKAG